MTYQEHVDCRTLSRILDTWALITIIYWYSIKGKSYIICWKKHKGKAQKIIYQHKEREREIEKEEGRVRTLVFFLHRWPITQIKHKPRHWNRAFSAERPTNLLILCRLVLKWHRFMTSCVNPHASLPSRPSRGHKSRLNGTNVTIHHINNRRNRYVMIT